MTQGHLQLACKKLSTCWLGGQDADMETAQSWTVAWLLTNSGVLGKSGSLSRSGL